MEYETISMQQAESILFQRAVELLESVHDEAELVKAISALNNDAQQLAGNRPVACKAGCPHCCVLNVAVLLPEAVAIASWLKNNYSSVELASLTYKLQKQALLVRWMEDSERIHRKTVCPFIDSTGCCWIYPVRPLVCRGVTSLDQRLCLELFDPSNLDAPAAIPVDTLRQAVFDAAFCALAHALDQAGISSRSIELSRGVLVFLQEPELLQKFISGGSMPIELWD